MSKQEQDFDEQEGQEEVIFRPVFLLQAKTKLSNSSYAPILRMIYTDDLRTELNII